MNKNECSQQCDQPMHYSVDEREVIHRTKTYQHGVIKGHLCLLTLAQGDLVPGQKDAGEEVGSINGIRSMSEARN